MENEIIYLNLEDIIPNRFQPREIFDETSLNELAESIRQHGVIQPIVVRKVENKYEIIAGERRYKASAIAGLIKIPAIVKDYDDKESSIVAYIENAQRKDVSAIEEARTSERILKTNNMTQDELAKELGISQSTLANKLRLLTLPNEVQESLIRNEISERHARSLLSVKDASVQLELLDKIKTNRMTVRDLDNEIKSMTQSIEDNINNELNNISEVKVPVESTTVVNDDSSKNYMDGFLNYLNTMNNANEITNNNQNNNLNTVNNVNDIGNAINIEGYGETAESSYDENTYSDFMKFLSGYDDSKLTEEILASQEGDLTSQINENADVNVSQSIPESYDNRNLSLDSTSLDEVRVEENLNNQVTVNDNMGFMDYSNSTTSETSSVEDNNGFMNFVDNNSLNVDNYNSPIASSSFDNNIMVDNNMYVDGGNTMIDNGINNDFDVSQYMNDIPETSFANDYVENNEDFVDVSKPVYLSSVDEIIEKLRILVDDIKNNSVYKINTDEIDFDDTYQITITIDRRDF